MTMNTDLFVSICALSEKALAEGVSVDELITNVRAQYQNAKEHSAASVKRTERADWDLVKDYLHYNGERYSALNEVERDSVWILADGFGAVSIGFIREQCYDWSHVRDSSVKAVASMAARIRELRPS